MPCDTRTLTLIGVLSLGLALGACGPSDDEIPTIDPNADNDFGVGQNQAHQGGETGAACQENDDCASDVCLEGDDWPDGYCTFVHCSDDTDCHGGFCMQNPQGNDFCARECDQEDSQPCRDGYACQPTPVGDDGWCSPEPEDYDPRPDERGVDVECEPVSSASAEIHYEIDESTDSYLIVPFSPNGGLIAPDGISTPDGEYIDFDGPNSFQLAGAQLFGVVNPTLIPATPQLEHQLAAGEHTYHLDIDDDEVCYYLLEDPGSPTSLDINVYLVGLDVDAETAPTDTNFQNFIAETESIFGQAGIQLGEVRYYDVPEEAEQQYSIIRDRGDVSDLVSYSRPPIDEDDDAISANVFITRSFSMSDGSEALGISLGIPGAAGLHGSGLSGVAMTGEYIEQAGAATQFSANIMAHELGHFLGLFHTSEHGGEAIDPLEDTPECDDLTNPTGCPDWGNLMFPMANSDNNELTDDQSHVISVNPLTQ